MPSKTLCEDVLAVEVAGAGERTLIHVKNGTSARFWCDTLDLLAVLRGFPLQVSAHEGYCQLRLDGDKVRLDFSVAGGRRKTCSVAPEELHNALETIRRSPSPLHD